MATSTQVLASRQISISHSRVSLRAEQTRVEGEKKVVEVTFDVRCPVMEELKCTISKRQYEGLPGECVQTLGTINVDFETAAKLGKKPAVSFYPDRHHGEGIHIRFGKDVLGAQFSGDEIYHDQVEIALEGIALRIAGVTEGDSDTMVGIEMVVNNSRRLRFIPPSKYSQFRGTLPERDGEMQTEPPEPTPPIAPGQPTVANAPISPDEKGCFLTETKP